MVISAFYLLKRALSFVVRCSDWGVSDFPHNGWSEYMAKNRPDESPSAFRLVRLILCVAYPV